MRILVRLRPHPSDTERVEILVPADANEIMGRYQPARLNTRRHCYEIHTEHLDTFMVFARLHGMHVTNEPRPYQPPALGGRCPCGKPDCTRNRTVTPAQAEINEWGTIKVRAAVKRHNGTTPADMSSVELDALAELDTWTDPIIENGQRLTEPHDPAWWST